MIRARRVVGRFASTFRAEGRSSDWATVVLGRAHVTSIAGRNEISAAAYKKAYPKTDGS